MPSTYDFESNSIDGQRIGFDQFAGKVLLIVNTASQCGFTPQYAGLEDLYQRYGARGLVVLAFPCNQFGAQEPGSAAEIGAFCQSHYGVSFPVFEKIEVNGDGAHPLFEWLKAQAPGVLGSKRIQWNFTKFLVDRSGAVQARYAPLTKPRAITGAIEALL